MSKFLVKGPNRTIEIDYPPQEDVNGFLTLKQGSRIYKIPYKNHTTRTPDLLPAKSDVPYTPDYLQGNPSDSETFKVKDTTIMKSTYRNGAKAIVMEKDQATLSYLLSSQE